MDILTEAIMDELLDEHNATPEEREQVRAAIEKTENPWDTVILLTMFRMATDNG